MKTKHGAELLVLGFFLLLLLSGCKQPHPGWEPPLEETSTRFLQNQVEEALQLVRNARDGIQVDPESVEIELDQAMLALERVTTYYLPLLEARERAYDAHRFLYFDQKSQARMHLEAVEAILDTMAEAGGPMLLPALKEPLDLASEAKAAVMAQSDQAPDLIKSLARKLNNMALRGELEIPSDWSGPDHPDD